MTLLVSVLLCLQGAKSPAPVEDARRKAEKTVRDLYKGDDAKKLVERALDTRDDDALRYVLYLEAAALAARTADVDSLLRSIDELQTGFEGVGPALKEELLRPAEPNLTRPEDRKRLGEVHLRVVQEALDQDLFDDAARAAKASKDAGLGARADAAVRSVAEAKAAFEKARKAEEVLAAAPDDPAANQVWGEWLCFRKGRWDRGLGYLAKGPVGPVRAMAAKEFSASPDLESLMAVADGWWDLADRERPPRQGQLRAHARSLYASLLPRATGDSRAKIGKRLEFDQDAPAKEPKKNK